MGKKQENKIIEAFGGTQRVIVVGALLLLIAFFSIFSDGGSFRSWSNILNVFNSSYYIGFMAIGVTFVIITGGIELSIGTSLMMIGLIGGKLLTMNVPMVVVLICMLLVGLLVGLINGTLVSRLGLPAFIATLGMMMVTRGMGSIITKVQTMTMPQVANPGGWFRKFFTLSFPESSNEMMRLGVPVGFVVLIILAVVMSIILNKTRPGRYIIAIGSNKEATRLSGVNVKLYETLAYIICGLFTAIAAIAYGAAFSQFTPSTGNGFEMDAIAGAVIGGTSLAGGVGSIGGTILGVYIMAVLKTGLPTIVINGQQVQSHWQLLITGIVLVIAVLADVANRKKNG